MLYKWKRSESYGANEGSPKCKSEMLNFYHEIDFRRCMNPQPLRWLPWWQMSRKRVTFIWARTVSSSTSAMVDSQLITAIRSLFRARTVLKTIVKRYKNKFILCAVLSVFDILAKILTIYAYVRLGFRWLTLAIISISSMKWAATHPNLRYVSSVCFSHPNLPLFRTCLWTKFPSRILMARTLSRKFISPSRLTHRWMRYIWCWGYILFEWRYICRVCASSFRIAGPCVSLWKLR